VRQQQLGEIGFFEKRLLRKVVASADGRPKEFAQQVGRMRPSSTACNTFFERNSVAAGASDSRSGARQSAQLDLAQVKENACQ